MLSFLQEWWSFLVVFVLAAMLAVKFWTVAGDAWRSGDWFAALQKTLGPLVSFILLSTIGMVAFSWSFSNIYARIEESIPAQALIKAGNSGMAAVAGQWESAPHVAMPETSLTEALQGAASSLAGAASGMQSSSAAPAASSNVVAPSVQAAAPVNNLGPSNAGSFHPSPHEIVPSAPVAAPVVRNLSADDVKGLPVYDGGNSGMGAMGESMEDYKKRTGQDGGGGPATYAVKSGDSLAKIAKAFGVSVNALCTANNIRNCNVIRSGQTLVIP